MFSVVFFLAYPILCVSHPILLFTLSLHGLTHVYFPPLTPLDNPQSLIFLESPASLTPVAKRSIQHLPCTSSLRADSTCSCQGNASQLQNLRGLSIAPSLVVPNDCGIGFFTPAYPLSSFWVGAIRGLAPSQIMSLPSAFCV